MFADSESKVTESKVSVDRDSTGPLDRWYQFGFLGVQTLKAHTLPEELPSLGAM